MLLSHFKLFFKEDKLNFRFIGTLSNKNGDGVRYQLWFCLRKKPRINSVRVNCVHDLLELFEGSIC